MKNINKTIKIATFLTIAIMLIMTVSSVFATVSVNPNNFSGNATDINTTIVTNWSNNIINVVSTIGSAAAIVMLIILGVKYMMGSAEEKAEYKKTLLPYIIGAVFVFGASVLTTVVFNFINNGK